MRLSSVFLLPVLYLFSVSVAVASEYSVIPLTELASTYPSSIFLNAVNDIGQIVGYAAQSNGTFKSFLYDDGVITNLGYLSNERDVKAWDINNSGEIVGTAENWSGATMTFIWSNGVMSVKHQDYSGTSREFINNLSQYADAGYLWSDNSIIQPLPPLTPGQKIIPYAINDSGVVVGSTYYSVGDQPVYWENGSVHKILSTPTTGGQASDVNNHNQIVGGFYNNTGFLWENGSISHTFPGIARSINDEGVVLIHLGGANADPTMLWDKDNGLRYLHDLIPDLPTGFVGWHMNNNGDIIGYALSLRNVYLIKHNIVPSVAPTISVNDSSSVDESNNLSFQVVASDPDGDSTTLSVSGLPAGASFNTSTGEFSWTPSYDDAGVYQVVFTATEDTLEALSAVATTTITVNNVNRAPIISPIADQVVLEGQTLTFTVTATDPDGDVVTLSATNTPSGSSFDSGTGVFSWTPTYDDAGNYPDIEFIATDDGEPMELALDLVTITVGDVNRMPVLTNPGPQEVLEDTTLSFTVTATDPDGDVVTLSATNTPSGSSFDSGTGVFSWTPTRSDAGIYTITFVATDNGTPVESMSLDVLITVGDNPTPVEETTYLINSIVAFDLSQSIENSYMANLQKVEQLILDGKIAVAINQLHAFLNKIEQDLQHGVISLEVYDSLFAQADKLLSDLTGN